MKDKIIKYITEHPHSKLPAICTDLKLGVVETAEILDELYNSGVLVATDMYPAHLWEYSINKNDV